MRRLAALFTALALTACGPFVKPAEAPTPAPVVEVQQPPVPQIPLPKPRPKATKKTAKSKPLGYSCETVRWAAATFPRSMIDTFGADLSASQKAEAKRCLRA